MPMASTFAFKFIGVFLALYISVASAAPTDGRSVSPNDTLRPREEPDVTLCPSFRWLRRECRPDMSVGSWMEVCEGEHPDASTYTYVDYSSCQPRYACEDVFDEDGDHTIKCVPIQEPGTSGKRKQPSDPQYGSSPVKAARISVQTTQLDTSVTIENDMKASVAAVLLSDDHKYAVVAHNIIVGKVRGKEITVCQGNKSNVSRARECYPVGHFTFVKGDVIDFT